MRTINDCQEGDILCDRTGSKARVLARIGDLIFRSEWYRYDIAAQHFVTVSEAKELGWKILLKDGREEMTVKELERLMPNVKIKK